MSDMTRHDVTCDAFAERLGAYLEGECSTGNAECMEVHAASCESCGALLADVRLIPREAAALPALVPTRDLWPGIAERIDARVLPMDAPRTLRPPSRGAWRRPALAAAALILVTAGVTHLLTRRAVAPKGAVVSGTASPRQVARVIAQVAPVAAEPAAVISSSLARRDAGDAVAGEGTAGSVRTVGVTPGAAGARTTLAARPGTARLVRAEPLLHEAEPVYDREITTLRVLVRQRRSQLDPRTVAVLEQSLAVIDSAIAQSRAALRQDPASGFLASQLNHSLEKKVELLRTAASLPART